MDPNGLLKQLAAEREARLAADEGLSTEVGRPEARCRKKKTPVRRPQEGDEREQTTSAQACKSIKRQSASTADQATATKRPKKRGPSAPTSLEFAADNDGGEFDAADVAGAFMRNDFGEGRDSLGAVAFDQFASAARIHALERNQAVITETEGHPVGQIRVEYKGNNRKVYLDHCRSYTAEQVVLIFRSILSYTQSSSKRRASSARHLLKPQKLAERYPPLLWSVFQSTSADSIKSARDLDVLVESFVTKAEQSAGQDVGSA